LTLIKAEHRKFGKLHVSVWNRFIILAATGFALRRGLGTGAVIALK